MRHICICFLLGGQKQQLPPPPPPPQQQQREPSQQNSLHHLGITMSRLTRTRACCNQRNQIDNNNNSGKQQHHQEMVVDPTKNANAESSDTTTTKNSVSFSEPLDVMLARARKRPINPFLKVQAFMDARIIPGVVPWLTYGDVVFCLVATSIGAKGFALGLLLGKWTSSCLLLPLLPLTTRQRMPTPLLVQLYPVLLAILLDQWISWKSAEAQARKIQVMSCIKYTGS